MKGKKLVARERKQIEERRKLDGQRKDSSQWKRGGKKQSQPGKKKDVEQEARDKLKGKNNLQKE